MRIFALVIFLVTTAELFAQETEDNFADSIIVCKSEQALGLPAMDRYVPGFKYIQDLPSQGEYVLKPVKKVIDVADLTNDEFGGFFTHKYKSTGSIIQNDDNIGLCWVDDLEKPFAIRCNTFIEGVHPTLQEIEDGDLRSNRKINQIKIFIQQLPYEKLKIHDGRFIATNRGFRDCDNPFCVRKQHVLLERGTCSVY